MKTVEYPEVAGLGRTKVGYLYNAHGYLEHVFDISPTVPSSPLWKVMDRNQDDALRVAHGGDWTTTLAYDDRSGKFEGIEVFDEAAKTSVLDLTYERDPNGFVERRTETVEGRDEVFHMDGHHRLKEWLLDYGKGGAGAGMQTSVYAYDAIDNLEKVSVSGSAVAKGDELFTHDSGGKPHALYNRGKSSDPQTFFYDARGRLTDGDGQQYAYTSFDLPRSVTTQAGTTFFEYDPSGSRVRKQGPGGTTTSLRGLFESHEGAGGFRYSFVVYGPDGPVAEIVYKPSEKEPRTVHYRHHDALGSVSVTTAQGGQESRHYYEPFGGHVSFYGAPVAAQSDDVRHGSPGTRTTMTWGSSTWVGASTAPARGSFSRPIRSGASAHRPKLLPRAGLAAEEELAVLVADSGGSSSTRLWRAVEAEELADVRRFGDYNIHPKST